MCVRVQTKNVGLLIPVVPLQLFNLSAGDALISDQEIKNV